MLESVGLWEHGVSELREKVRHALQQAAVLLRAYAHEYERHLALNNIDIESHLR